MAKLRMVGGDFILAAAMAWRILAKAVGHINDAKCLELVETCRFKSPSGQSSEPLT